MNSENRLMQTKVENGCGGKSIDANFPARPAFHFTPPTGWMNDPNGLVYYRGEFHLFYQHNPHGPDFGPMHWGHAATRDFVNWRHLPIALHPDENGLIYSGSVVVDWNNTSGFGDGDNPPLVALYTNHHPERERGGHDDHQTQALAYSVDGGESWSKYAGNPVLGNEKRQPDFRDPKIFWYGPSGQWIKVLAVGDHIEFFSSPDLKKWTFTSGFSECVDMAGKVWECPDLFPLKTPDGAEKWVLIVSINPGGPQGGSGTQYFIGEFDGQKFSLDAGFAKVLRKTGTAWLDWGSDNYAGVSWSDVPQSDGRRLIIGWMSNWKYAQNVPASDWRGAMTTPRELSLRRVQGAILLAANPVCEVMQQLAPADISHITPHNSLNGITTPFRPGEIKLAAKACHNSTAKIGLELRNRTGEKTRIGFDSEVNEYFCEHLGGGNTAFTELKNKSLRGMPRIVSDREVRMQFLIDRNSVELFADDGVSNFAESFFPECPYDEVAVAISGDGADCVTVEFREIMAGNHSA